MFTIKSIIKEREIRERERVDKIIWNVKLCERNIWEREN